jgi:CRP-like cAMP-binding protein
VSAVRTDDTGSLLSHNSLLAALPLDTRRRLHAAIDIVPMKLKDVLHAPGEAIQHVYFPGGGFCSIVTVLRNGTMVEVATVGKEGLLGTPSVLTRVPPSSLTMVQGAADICYRLPADAFRAEMERRERFYEVALNYTEAHTGAIMQSTACNAVHSIEQRLARWLLLAGDRMETQEFPLTQEFVAMMLGASRPTVTIVAGTLQKAGLITYHRGRVSIIDRERLELVSCECYCTVKELLARVVA